MAGGEISWHYKGKFSPNACRNFFHIHDANFFQNQRCFLVFCRGNVLQAWGKQLLPGVGTSSTVCVGMSGPSAWDCLPKEGGGTSLVSQGGIGSTAREKSLIIPREISFKRRWIFLVFRGSFLGHDKGISWHFLMRIPSKEKKFPAIQIGIFSKGWNFLQREGAFSPHSKWEFPGISSGKFLQREGRGCLGLSRGHFHQTGRLEMRHSCAFPSQEWMVHKLRTTQEG